MNRSPNLRSIDLNLIPILRELIRTRSVSQTAKTLQMRQPHVSEALQRLRQVLSDEILVRVGQVMVPTAYMTEITPLIEDIIIDTSSLASKVPSPVESKGRQFVVAAPDIVIAAVAPMLESMLIEQELNLTVKFIDFRIRTSTSGNNPPSSARLEDLTWADADLFEAGSIDMVVAPSPVLLNLPYKRIELYSDELTYIAPRSPVDDKFRGAANIMGYRSIACRTDFKNLNFESPVGNGKIDMIGIAQTLLLPLFLHDTKLISLVTKRVAGYFLQSSIIDVIDNVDNLSPITFYLHWLSINDSDIQHQWLRKQLSVISGSI